jgi:hypothetical protein
MMGEPPKINVSWFISPKELVGLDEMVRAALWLCWQPIDTAPKDGTQILLWDPDSRSANVGYWTDQYTKPFHALVRGDDANWDGGPEPIFDATHWMPLTAPRDVK